MFFVMYIASWSLIPQGIISLSDTCMPVRFTMIWSIKAFVSVVVHVGSLMSRSNLYVIDIVFKCSVSL